jgi:hypothetical protein
MNVRYQDDAGRFLFGGSGSMELKIGHAYWRDGALWL